MIALILIACMISSASAKEVILVSGVPRSMDVIGLQKYLNIHS